MEKPFRIRYYKNPTLPNLKAIYDFDKNYDSDMAYYKALESQGVQVHWINARIVTTIGNYIE